MKKALLFLSMILTMLAYKANAQCTPDSALTFNGISPETLPDAMAGYYYSSTLSFKIPRDSSISGVKVTVDSAKFLYATGKPPGFNFACNNADCLWPGGTKGCALFYGQVDSNFTDSVAEFPMKIYTMTWYRFTGGVDQFQRIDSATNYSFKIVKYLGIAELTTYQRLSAYPNPSTGKVTIELRDLANDKAEVKVMDAFGKLVWETTVADNNRFMNAVSVDLSAYAPGLYFITVKSGDKLGMSKVMLR
jgi:hypothetical protein